MGKDKCIRLKDLCEDIQYFGDDGNIKEGDIIELKYKAPVRVITQGAIEAPHFWGGEYKHLKDTNKNEFGEGLESIIILNKSYILITKGALEKGEQKIPAGEPYKVTLDKIEHLKKLSDYVITPSETP